MKSSTLTQEITKNLGRTDLLLDPGYIKSQHQTETLLKKNKNYTLVLFFWYEELLNIFTALLSD